MNGAFIALLIWLVVEVCITIAAYRNADFELLVIGILPSIIMVVCITMYDPLCWGKGTIILYLPIAVVISEGFPFVGCAVLDLQKKKAERKKKQEQEARERQHQKELEKIEQKKDQINYEIRQYNNSYKYDLAPFFMALLQECPLNNSPDKEFQKFYNDYASFSKNLKAQAINLNTESAALGIEARAEYPST